MNIELYAHILEVSKRDNREEIINLERLIKKELEKNPRDTELLIRLAILVSSMPFADQQNSADILSEILEYDPHNGIVMVLRAYMQYWYSRLIHNKSWVDELSSVVTGDAEIDSMMRYVASLYYEIGDQDMREKLLIQSINLCQDYVYNYRDLASLYLKQGKFEQASKLVRHALNNIKMENRGGGYPKPDITDYHEFIAEFITGTYAGSSSVLEMLCIQAESTTRMRLKEDPTNVMSLLDLAKVELIHCCYNKEEQFKTVNKILLQDPDNTTALLLLASRKSLYHEYDEILINKLISLKTADPEINSMLLFAASRFYTHKDVKKEEELLLQAIKEYPYHVKHNLQLAKIYDASHRYVEAKKLKQRAFYNITRVLSETESAESVGSAEKFITQDIKGTWAREYDYKKLYDEVSKYNKE